MKQLITHPGRAHRDDFLAICIALATLDKKPILLRKEPTTEELDNPDIMVLDVGRRHEPELNNFDHHQFPMDKEPECAFTLLAKHLKLEESLSYNTWYRITAETDVLGPKLAANRLGLPKFPFELISPIETALIELFSEFECLPPEHDFYKLMRLLGEQIISSAELQEAKVHFYLAELSKTNNAQLSIVNMKDGLRGFLLDDVDSEGLGYVRDKLYPDIAFLIRHNDRGPGWSLYRYNDDPRLDFSLIKDDEDVKFSHAGGFIAKTKERISRERLIRLLQLSRTDR